MKRELPPAEVETVAQTSVSNYQKNLQIVDALAPAYGLSANVLVYGTFT